MPLSSLFSILFTAILSCTYSQQGQPIHIGGPCEGCEAIYESGDRKLSAAMTLPGYDKSKPKLHISGTIYHQDRTTPAKDVILYIYHTNERGIYPTRDTETGWARRHGYIRGWIKTGPDGRYSFKTFRPASYPDTRITAHIHATVKEPGLNEYYIDEYLFDDDPFLTTQERNSQPQRGGSGILKTHLEEGILFAERDIVLGLNIPGYPK